jgi:hypothetical protein
MDAIKEEIPDVVVGVLLGGGPQERHGFAVGGLCEGCEGYGDVGVFGNVTAALGKDAKGGAELVEVGGWDHPADGVEVFGGEADAGGVNLKAKENTYSWDSQWRF